MKKIILGVFILTFVLGGCAKVTQNTEVQEINDGTEADIVDVLEVRSERYEDFDLVKKHVVESNEDGNYEFDITYPYVELKNNKKGENEFNKAIEEMLDEEKQYLIDNAPDFKIDLTDRPCSLWVDYEVKFNSMGMLSVLMNVSRMTATMPHPINNVETYNYSVQQDELLDIYDLLNDQINSADMLSAKLKEKLVKEQGFDTNSIELQDGLFPLELLNYPNYNLTDEGLLWTFEQYQIASYSAGNVEVLFDYEELEDLYADGFLNFLVG